MEVKAKIKPLAPEKKSYGNITLCSSDFPGVKNLKLGSPLELTIKVEVTSLRQADRWEVSEQGYKPNDVIANIKVIDVEVEDEKEK